MGESWIKLFRKFREWEWYSDINVSRVFLELLLTVNFEDKKWHGIDINRGSIITSISNLALTSKLSAQQVRTSLDKLKSTNEITIKTTNKYTLITINKYNEYQDINKQPNKQITNHQQTNNKQITTTKEYKNIKNNTFTSLEFLKNIPLKELELISKELGIGQDKVIKKARELYDWCIINGKKKKNYYLFLRVCLHKDFIEPKTSPVRSESSNYIKL